LEDEGKLSKRVGSVENLKAGRVADELGELACPIFFPLIRRKTNKKFYFRPLLPNTSDHFRPTPQRPLLVKRAVSTN
jgi:hypothetical protein